MAQLTIRQKKEWAKTLFVSERLTQKEIAMRTGVSEKTLSLWVNKENWDALRVSLTITKDAQLKRLYAQLEEINTAIEKREEGLRYSNTKDADIIVKITTAIKALETETGIAEIVEVFTGYNNWLKNIDLVATQSQIKLQDEYLSTKLK
jgi:transcriptional regulator with XRE-family HTH domain